MHYIVHVFTEPGGSVEDALEPFRERYESDAEDAEYVGEWDWWVTGGRWEGYFNGENSATAGDLAAGVLETRLDSPYAYLTLDGRWLPKEEYVPEGFPNPSPEHPDRVGYFREVEGYAEQYLKYVSAVPADTMVTTVDIHS
jgi:hypothetical protein